jgi:hypothetical protein
MCGDMKYYARLWKKQAEERKELEREAEKRVNIKSKCEGCWAYQYIRPNGDMF